MNRPMQNETAAAAMNIFFDQKPALFPAGADEIRSKINDSQV